MNKIHRTVWNATLGAYVAAPENARGRGRGAGAVGAALATFLLAGAAQAQTTINTVDTGWYNNLGTHGVGNTNYITGNYANGSGATIYRSYFVFDIGSAPLAADQVFSGATLNVNTMEVAGLPANGAAFQTVLYGGDASALGTTSTSTATYAALGGGVFTGSAAVSSATPSHSTLSVQLNAAALGALTAAAGQRIAFGGSLTGISGASSYIGASSFGAQSLTYTVTTLAAGQYYWDLDGSTAGAGGTSPSGIWGRTNAQRFWNANSSGVGPTVAWINGSTANFAAGNDATGNFTVTLGDNVTVNGINYRGSSGSQLRIDAGTGFEIATTAGNNIVDVMTDGATLELGAVVSGPGALVKDGLGTLVLSNANTYGGTTTISAGTLQVGDGGTSGTLGMGPVTNNAALVFNRSDSATVTNAIGGSGTLTQAGAGTTVLTGNNSYGATTISAGTLQVGNGGTTGTLGMGPVTNNAALVFNRSDNISVANAIGGSGSVTQNGSGTLALSGSNAYGGGTTLNNGTLLANGGSALGTGTLTVNGGTLSGNGNVSNAVTVNADFDAAGYLALAGDITLNGPTRITAVTTPISSYSHLFLSGAIGGVGGLTLGSSLTPYGSTQVVMSGAASNTYGGSTTVQGTQLVVLQKTGGAIAIPGDLTIEGTAIVAPVQGEQIASTSTVTVNSVGQVATTIGGAPVSLEGLIFATWAGGPFTQTLAALNGSGTVGLSDATLRLGAGDFSGILSNGSFADVTAAQGGPSFNGKLEKFGPGTLTLSGANTYTGGTALKGGTLAVGNDSALGTGGLAMDDNTTLAFAADGLTIANPITMTGTNDPTFDTGSHTATLTGGIVGAADLTKTGTGTLILGAANNTYSGSTTVAQGTLRAGAVNAFSPASATTVAAGATLDLAGYNQTLAALNNSGTVSLAGSTPGTTLTVTGPWVGNGGTLALSTAVSGNASATDRLVLSGSTAVASGSTKVAVTNLGGLGGQTTGNGIELISAQDGASIGAGAFSLAAPVAAGAYEYRLNTTSTGGYLSSTTTIPVVPVIPVTPDTPAAPAGPTVPTYRAEVPLYAALPEQLRQANLAMLGNLHQRVGDDGVSGANTATPGQGMRQAWGRVISIDRDIAQGGTVSPTSNGRLTGFQAGTDLWANPNWRAGVYVGQLDGDMSVTGFARGIAGYAAGSNDLRNQYLGAYATWKNDSGLYLDGVLQAGRHRTTVNPAAALESSGKGDSLLASVEVGQAFNIAPNWTVEPQLQLVHQRISLDDGAITGARVQQDSHSGWMARAGVRIKGQIETGSGTLQPYARVNVYKRSSGTDITRFIGPAAYTDIATRTGGTSSELAAGATWQLSQNTSVYGEIGKLWASGGGARTKSGVNGSAGVKVRW